jgi:hypothetical protein
VATANGDVAARGNHGGRAHRDIDDDGIVFEIDFVPAAVRAAKDGEHVVFPRTGEKKIDDIGN